MKFIAFAAAVFAASSASAADWVKLFDGKTLDGWIQKNGTAKYKVVDGTIHGTTNEGSPNSFLCSEKEYGDFELEFEVKVHNSLNSGVQIRSKTKEPKGDAKFGRVYGPQVEIEASGAKGAEAGYVYGEATGLGWLTSKEDLKPHKTMKDGEWNKFRVVAKGATISTWINGRQIEELTHAGIYKTHPKGFIGLQVHGIRKGTGPYDVAWKNIRIKVLD
jgi:opacity protein-like surface antigen